MSLRRSLSVNPDQARTRLYLGQSYALQGRRELALEELRDAKSRATRDEMTSSQEDLRAEMYQRPVSDALRAALKLLTGD